jgi:hypothetical protein
MFERAPNGFFVRNLIVFNLLRRGGYVAKGFVFEAPDLTNSQVADLNDFQDQLCLLLASLHENQRLQVQYFCDSDYKGELLRYQQETEKFSNVWTKRARNERFARYWQAMSERKLRRQRVIFYISRSLENVPNSFQSAGARRDYYHTLLDQLETEFDHVHRLLLEIFGSSGSRILPMNDLDHFRYYKRFLNPSLNDRFDYDPAEGFEPELSIQENCWHSEGSGQSDFGFFLDGNYHSIIVLTRWPRTTYAPATPELKAFVEELAARAERLKSNRVDPSIDNMLKITSEGRKAALDLRLMKPSAPDDPQGKVNQAVENIFRIWQESKPERSAQLVFCDLSTPKDRGFSVYRDAAKKLERLGVPSGDIAFIQDYDSDAAKLSLFRDVRSGKVRVLFGSTQKMGSGTNVQERLLALHHLDAPWRPSDVEQREGRILRQGNKNEVVSVYRYVTEGSFDAYMWQTLETKAKFIAQVMSGDMTIRRLEDLDSAALTYAEVKAIASGNPLVIEKAQVDAELIRLTRLRSAHAEEQYRIRTNLRRSHEDAEAFTGRLTNLRQDIAARQDTSGDKFSIELDGQVLDNRGIAGELIVRRAEKIKSRFGDDVRIGRFAGFDLFLRPSFNNNVEMIVRGQNSYAARVTDTALGTIRSLEANVQCFEERASKLEYDITDANRRAKELEPKVGAHFEREERYQELTRRQGEIEEKLDLTKNQAPSQAEAADGSNEEKIAETQNPQWVKHPKHHVSVTV